MECGLDQQPTYEHGTKTMMVMMKNVGDDNTLSVRILTLFAEATIDRMSHTSSILFIKLPIVLYSFRWFFAGHQSE